MDPIINAESIAVIHAAIIQSESTIKAAEIAAQAQSKQSIINLIAGTFALVAGIATIIAARIQVHPLLVKDKARTEAYKQRIIAVIDRHFKEIDEAKAMIGFLFDIKLADKLSEKKLLVIPNKVVSVPAELDAAFWELHSLLGEEFVRKVVECVETSRDLKDWIEKHKGKPFDELTYDEDRITEFFKNPAKGGMGERVTLGEWYNRRLQKYHDAVCVLKAHL